MPCQPAFGKLVSVAEFICSLSSHFRSLDARKFNFSFWILQSEINGESSCLLMLQKSINNTSEVAKNV